MGMRLIKHQRGSREPAIPELLFRSTLAREKRRCERSGQPFGVVNVDLSELHEGQDEPELLESFIACLQETVRETDLVGWQSTHRVAGVILTELGECPRKNISKAIVGRLVRSFTDHLPGPLLEKIRIDVHFFDKETGLPSAHARTTSELNDSVRRSEPRHAVR